MASSSAAGAARLGVAFAGVLVLAGCAAPSPMPVPEPTKTATAAPAPAPSAPAVPVLVEGGTASENQPYFDMVNQEFFRTQGTGSSRAIVDNLVAAGFTKQDMEVTPDRTAIDLIVDSRIVSVRIKGECLIGDFQASGIKSIVGPVLGTGSCLVGKTLPIDW